MGRNNWRINSVLIFIFLASALVFGRIFYVSYVQHGVSRETVLEQYDNLKDSLIERGDITIRSQNGGAVNVAGVKDSPFVYLSPKDIKDGEAAISAVLSVFPLVPREKIYPLALKEGDPFELLERNPTEEQIKKVKEINIPGLNIGYEKKRTYPLSGLMAHLVGFLGFSDGKRAGQYGVEGFYDKELKNNTSLVLTIDPTVQNLIESKLSALMNNFSAPSGTILVQNPDTGAVLGMVGSPSFDPNFYGSYPLENFINPAMQETFEPGSTFKAITMAAGIDSGKVGPSTTYEDKGIVQFSDYAIKNFDGKVHGVNTMTQVLEKSLNTGAVFVQNLLGKDLFLNYAVNFGFGKKTEIDLFGEAQGNISNLYSGRPINFATASFGQGIAVTPIQMINAYSAIANGGKLMKPYVVNEFIFPDGKIKKNEPKIVGTPIRESSSSVLKSILVSVVQNGFDKARVGGYDVAAKTGTAQIPGVGGYSDEFIHSIIGFAPAFSPKFVVLIKLDKPKGLKFAADTLSPTFAEITKFLLNYYEIPPVR